MCRLRQKRERCRNPGARVTPDYNAKELVVIVGINLISSISFILVACRNRYICWHANRHQRLRIFFQNQSPPHPPPQADLRPAVSFCAFFASFVCASDTQNSFPAKASSRAERVLHASGCLPGERRLDQERRHHCGVRVAFCCLSQRACLVWDWNRQLFVLVYSKQQSAVTKLLRSIDGGIMVLGTIIFAGVAGVMLGWNIHVMRKNGVSPPVRAPQLAERKLPTAEKLPNPCHRTTPCSTQQQQLG